MRSGRVLSAVMRGFALCANVSLLGLLVVALSCGRTAFRPSETAKPTQFIPQAIFPSQLTGGFSLAAPPERFSPNDLWKKINGAADLFISYGFREMLAGGFARSGSRLPELEVSVYEMGSDLNAMGVYLQERSENAEKAAVGWEGSKSEDGLFFHKGPYYVKIVDLSKEGSLDAVADEAARKIDGAIRVARRAVPEMQVFPSAGLVPGSVLYVHRDALGHGFLQRVFRANYILGDTTATLFYCRQKGAEQLLAKYRDYAGEFGQVEREWQEGDFRVLSLRAFGHPELVFVRGDVFGGVQGCRDPLAALGLIRALVTNIDRRLGAL